LTVEQSMQIKTVGVLGCGLMGSGIAQVCAAAGYKTIVREVDEIALDKGLGRIRKFLDDGVAKGKVSADARDKTLGGLSGTTTFSGLGECDLVIEAIIENLEDKRRRTPRSRRSCGPTPLRVEHVVVVHHGTRGGFVTAGSVRRTALLQSGAADEAGGGDQGADHER
jgi:3-hydroxybutyryl-CoA dehydrogenase